MSSKADDNTTIEELLTLAELGAFPYAPGGIGEAVARRLAGRPAEVANLHTVVRAEEHDRLWRGR